MGMAGQNIQVNIVIPQSELQAMNQWMADWGFGPGNFTVALYRTSDSVLTHYGLSLSTPTGNWSILNPQFSIDGGAGQRSITNGNLQTFEQLIASLSLKKTA
jgi:hypothetical protein